MRNKPFTLGGPACSSRGPPQSNGIVRHVPSRSVSYVTCIKCTTLLEKEEKISQIENNSLMFLF